jgi:hypothetical protein
MLGATWFVAQIYVLFHPPIPMLARPLHVTMATVIVILWQPLKGRDGETPLYLRVRPADHCFGRHGGLLLLRADYLTEQMERRSVLSSDAISVS